MAWWFGSLSGLSFGLGVSVIRNHLMAALYFVGHHISWTLSVLSHNSYSDLEVLQDTLVRPLSSLHADKPF